MTNYRTPAIERFWRHVEKTDTCWLWTGGRRGSNGYGQFWRGDQRPTTAHRAAYEFFVGSIPNGALVCHTCDVPLCVRPEHLFLGTPQDNMTDKVQKGRLVHDRPAKKLTAAQVLTIRSRFEANPYLGHRAQLAAEFGISRSTITLILDRKTWPDI